MVGGESGRTNDEGAVPALTDRQAMLRSNFFKKILYESGVKGINFKKQQSTSTKEIP